MDELQVLGQREDSAEQGEEGDADCRGADAEAGAAEEAEVEHRLVDATLPPEEGAEQRNGGREESEDGTGGPALPGGFDDRVDEEAEAGGGERGAGQVERAGPGIAALGHVANAEQQRGGRERDVDHEHGRPVEPLEQKPAGQRAEPDPDRRQRRPDRDRLAALLAGEQVGDDRERGGHDQRRPHTHRRAHRDHLIGGVCDEGAEAGQPEDRDAGLECTLAPEAVAERAEDEQQTGEDEQVGVDHPLQLRGGGVELVLQRRQGDVEDRVVEPDDHQAQRQHAERLPAARVLDGVDGHQTALLSGASGSPRREPAFPKEAHGPAA